MPAPVRAPAMAIPTIAVSMTNRYRNY